MKDCKFILKDKTSTFIDEDAVIGENVIIYENNRIEGKSVIEDNVTIYPNCFIDNSIIKKGSKIFTSVIVNCEIGECASIGPFVNLRLKSRIGSFVKVGSFCEIKDSIIGNHSKINSLTNISNTEIGQGCKIGSFVNFKGQDGKAKIKSKVGDNTIIESGLNFRSVVSIESNKIITDDSQVAIR